MYVMPSNSFDFAEKSCSTSVGVAGLWVTWRDITTLNGGSERVSNLHKNKSRWPPEYN